MATQKRTAWQQRDNLCQQYGRTPVYQMATTIRGKKDPDEDRTMEFVLCTAGIKGDLMEVVPRGADFSIFRKNPRMLWVHNDGGRGADPAKAFPIGTSLREWVSKAGEDARELGEHVRAKTRFLTADKNPLAEQAWLCYRDGDLDAVSIRWDEKEGDPKAVEEITPAELREAGYLWVPDWLSGVRFNKWYLLEWSGVPLPQDKDALAKRLRSASFPQQLAEQFVMPRPQRETEDGRPILHLTGRPFEEVDARVWVDQGGARAGEKVEESEEAPPTPGMEEVPPAEETPPVDQPADSPTSDEPEAPAAEAAPETDRVLAFADHGRCPVAPAEHAFDPIAAQRRVEAWAGERKGRSAARAYLYRHNGVNRGLHHDVIGGRLVSVPSALRQLAQRHMQGAGYPEAFGDAAPATVEAHLAEEFRQASMTVPWEAPSGVAYRTLHRQLRDIPADAAEGVRSAIVTLAAECFGADRAPEAWEHAKLPEGPETTWASVRTLLTGVVADVVADGEERDARVASAMTALDAIIGPALRAHTWMAAALERIGAQARIPLRDDAAVERLLHWQEELMTLPEAERSRPVDEPDLSEVIEIVQSVDAKRATPQGTEQHPEAVSMDSLLDLVLPRRESGAAAP